MNEIQAVVDWITDAVGAGVFTYARGGWNDSAVVADERLCVIRYNGGGDPGPDMRQPRLRVLLLGKHADRTRAGAVLELEQYAQALMQRALDGVLPCGFAQMRAIGDILGPGFTAEDRPWYELNFQTII